MKTTMNLEEHNSMKEKREKKIKSKDKDKDRKSTRLNSSHIEESRMPSSA